MTDTLNKLSKNNKTEYPFELCRNKYLEQLYDIVPCLRGCFYELIQSEINFQDSNSLVTEDSSSSLNVCQSKLIKDNIRVRGIVISTVMMIAQRSYQNITPEHVKCTETYFENIKGKNDHPHNISKILEILKNLQNSGIIEHASETEKNHFQVKEEDIYTNNPIN
ncbi:hypothetical protein M0802_012671 [Mischocyttarus mexicanus]|nr:hypothetical protein M0802_012671 [Mischocyttarus mexicanus]